MLLTIKFMNVVQLIVHLRIAHLKIVSWTTLHKAIAPSILNMTFAPWTVAHLINWYLC